METNCINCQKPKNRNATKFCSLKCQNQFQRNEKIKSGNYSFRCAKQYLLDIEDKCSICGIKDWQNKPLVKILDHIDGNANNNELSNLRLVCSNCDSQLPTYKSKNIGKGRHSRKERYKNGQSF